MAAQHDEQRREQHSVSDRRLTWALAAFLAAAAIASVLGAPSIACVGAGLGAVVVVWGATSFAPVPIAVPVTAAPAPDITGTLIDAIDDPLLIVEGRRITHANGAAVDLFGADRLDGDFRLALRHPLAAELLAEDAPSSPSASIELVGIGRPDRRWIMSVRRLDGDARLVRLRDRTESWVAERMRVDFVANASHELRTPLATLLGFIETLSDHGAGGDAATRDRFLKIMFGEARRMQQLVDDLISLSRIEADRFSPPQTPLALAPVVEEVAGVIRSGLRDSADRLVLELERTNEVRADRVQVGQLLHNLIGNAVKYGKPDTPIRVAVRETEAGVRLSVTDEGDGIAPEHLPRLTERFYRVDPGRSRAVGGTGLGLAIVKHIAERHRAKLAIDSRLGVGTTVSITFPPATPEALSS
jgi:two-component system phosphate regulon sensor histidine kinase PhoR